MIGDTIAAISSPLGEGGIGIVRLSGPAAIDIADSLFCSARGRRLCRVPSHTLHYGHIVVGERPIDEVLVSVMRAPRTYTREDVVEINCHGGIVASRAVLDAVLAGGARLAERGEFTRRAFLNGRLSLDQAQAVLDVVQAKTALGLEAAVDRLGGRFADAIADLRTGIVEVLADLEVEIDFPDLDVDVDALLPRVVELEERIDYLLAQSEQGRVVREGLTVAIIGRPNVGKSTLLNALLAEERAIVTPIPGTTRDTVEETAAIGGVPVRFIDTAGLREPTDVLEEEGVRRARRAVDRADLVLLLLDRSESMTTEDCRLLETDWGAPVLLVLTKDDLPPRLEEITNGPAKGAIAISAQEGCNIERLRARLLDLLLEGEIPARNTVLLLDSWERDLLRRVGDAVSAARGAIEADASPDMVAEELRSAYRVAGELQGIDVSESILDAIFSRFCVGK
jgi:tRNA modification GTPase